MYYCEPVFRPPSEGRSLLVTATVGCTYRCVFCIPYMKKKFRVRPVEDIVHDLRVARDHYGSRVRRVFFLDGNAMVMPAPELAEITRAAFDLFPRLERVTVYAHSKDILAKTPEELHQLREAGLKMAYVGIETGNDALLKKINKRVTADEIVAAGQRLQAAGILYSGTIILGLSGADAGLQASHQHAIDTAKVVNRLQPPSDQAWYIGALTLMIPPGTTIAKWIEQGKFEPLDSRQILEELLVFLEHTDPGLRNLVFRANHASNYLPLKGTLGKDRDRLISIVREGLENPRMLRPEFYRGL